jgi:penicillin-binding protein 1A
VGAKKIADTARRLGITADMIDDMSISLGTTEVTLLELVSAYATFAHKGKSVWAYGIVEIRNRHGDILYQREGNTENQVIDPKYVRQMNQMLMNVVSHGTGRRAQLKCPPSVKGDVLPQVAGKTGSNGDYDAWFIGFTPDLVAGIWTGNDHNTPMHKNSTGSRLPAETFSAFMSPLSCSLSSKESLISRDEEAMTLEAEEESKEVLNIDEIKDDPTGENKGENKDDFEDLLTQAAQE